MIPKIIHYCWFGRGDMPKLAKKCLKSWKKYLPEYEIMVWNEDSFDLNLYTYAKEAYQERKFAFVTDVCRLYALKEYGGIYMDTDVEILKPLTDDLLSNAAFSGFEDNLNVPTGLMASVKNGQWVTDLLSYYDGKSFYNKDGSLDTTTNVKVITKFMTSEKSLVLNDSLQSLEGYCTLYPSDYFCPKSWQTLAINITANTYCIHHFAGSWLSKPHHSLRYKIVLSLFGEKSTKKLFDIFQKIKI